MPTQHERVNDFETIRQMLRDMYVDGSKLAIEYRKSNGENRRQLINEWLEGGVAKTATEKGDVLHIPIDSRSVARNPFYNLWRSKAFRDKDVFLFFAIFDILHSPEIEHSVAYICNAINYAGYETKASNTRPSYMINPYLRIYEQENRKEIDAHTVTNALQTYCEQGLLYSRENGSEVLYRRAESVGDAALAELLSFFSEAAPCGVLGSFLMDKMEEQESVFRFKHHYLVSALDSDVLARVLDAMHGHYAVTVKNQSGNQHLVIPLRIRCSVKTGRQYLMAYNESKRSFQCFRIDQISLCDMETDVSFPPEYCRELRRRLDETQDHVWGVTLKTNVKGETVKKHVEFLVHIDPRDPTDRHVIERLNREKRVGTVEMIDDHTYRFSADVCSTKEMKPWVRSFLGYISDLRMDEGEDLEKELGTMYRMYQLGEEEQA